VRDEDLLKKVAKEGKVQIGGKEFPIRPSGLKDLPTEVRLNDAFTSEYDGTFSDPNYVKAPDFPIEGCPSLVVSDLKPRVTRTKMESYSPEVALREGIRAALRGGLTQEKIKEIFELELVQHVMDS
jgi:hypothetical protein